MERTNRRARAEMKAARQLWGPLESKKMRELRSLVEQHKISILHGDVMLLANRWYITYSCLLRCAHRHHCSSIETTLEARFSDPAANRWVFRATVYGLRRLKSFVGYGDADPSNVSPMARGAELRIAETRAVNRALRKAYGIGICSVEELGSLSNSSSSSTIPPSSSGTHSTNGSINSQPRLRDRLCVLIRQHNLDPNLVKLYAADFCGTEAISDASRELVESFIAHLSCAAKENRDVLVCKLNSYAHRVETQS